MGHLSRFRVTVHLYSMSLIRLTEVVVQFQQKSRSDFGGQELGIDTMIPRHQSSAQQALKPFEVEVVICREGLVKISCSH